MESRKLPEIHVDNSSVQNGSVQNVGTHPGASEYDNLEHFEERTHRGASLQGGGSSFGIDGESVAHSGEGYQQNVGTHPGASEYDNVGHFEERAHRGASLQGGGSISELRRRKSPRCDFHNYSGGDYFVTICTRDKEHFFGKIENGKMIFSEIGQVTYDRLATLSQHYEYLEVPVFVVMPNHIHAILCINGEDYNSVIPSQRTALSVIVGGYKQSVTSYARRNNIEFAWQNRYHDHIIRGTNDGNLIAEYIENNIIRWESDCFYPKLETY